MSAAEAQRERLRDDLKRAMREKRGAAVALLRQLIAAIDNAEAVETSPRDVLAGQARFGDGSNEVARRVLGESDLAALFAREAQEREAAASALSSAGRDAAAADLLQAATLIRSYLPPQ